MTQKQSYVARIFHRVARAADKGLDKVVDGVYVLDSFLGKVFNISEPMPKINSYSEFCTKVEYMLRSSETDRRILV